MEELYLISTFLQSIEKELLERLKKGVYGDIYNYPVEAYNEVLEMEELQAASEEEEVVLQSTLALLIPYLKRLRFDE